MKKINFPVIFNLAIVVFVFVVVRELQLQKLAGKIADFPDAVRSVGAKLARAYQSVKLKVEGFRAPEDEKFGAMADDAMQKVIIPYGATIKAEALAQSILPEYLAALVYVESRGNQFAPGAAGELGLMQVTPAALDDVNRNFGKSFTREDLFVSARNIQAGTLFLKLQIKRAGGNLSEGLRFYNCGQEGAVQNLNCGVDYSLQIQNLAVALNQRGYFRET